MIAPIKKEFWIVETDRPIETFHINCVDKSHAELMKSHWKSPLPIKHVISADWVENQLADVQGQHDFAVKVAQEYSKTIDKQELQIRKLKKALKEAREQFALMAEGEGNNPKTYQIMSRAAMLKTDEVLKDE